tara:strand:+ start:846 stop:1076 length:231 start_codon:yes stop_codon:yes gene_type:complete
MTAKKKVKKKPRINEEQLEMARLYEKAWRTLFDKKPECMQQEIINNHDGRTAEDMAHEVAKLAEKWAYENANNEPF